MPESVNISQAFFAGVIGTAGAIVIIGAGRAVGIDVGLEDTLAGARTSGLGALLLGGGIVALAYGFGFERLARHADVRWLALAFGAVHAAVALHLLASLGAVPAVAAGAVAVLVAAHLAFALVTGVLYRAAVVADRLAGRRAGEPAPGPLHPGRVDRAA